MDQMIRTVMYSVAVSGLLVLLVVIYLGKDTTQLRGGQREPQTVTNFATCKSMGYPLIALYPEQCKGPDGTIFINLREELATTTVSTPSLHNQRAYKP